MAGFPLCPACASEYHGTSRTALHAQPVAGPLRELRPRRGSRRPARPAVEGFDAALGAAQATVRGEIVAIKGLGGLPPRLRRNLPRSRPAVARSESTAPTRSPSPSWCETWRRPPPWPTSTRSGPAFSSRPNGRSSWCAAGTVLRSPRWSARLGQSPGSASCRPTRRCTTCSSHRCRPRRRAGRATRAPGGPGGAWVPAVLVVDGNLIDEPICFEDDRRAERLGPSPTGWLHHDRPIDVPCDDSVLELDPATGRGCRSGAHGGTRPSPCGCPSPPNRRWRSAAN